MQTKRSYFTRNYFKRKYQEEINSLSESDKKKIDLLINIFGENENDALEQINDIDIYENENIISVAKNLVKEGEFDLDLLSNFIDYKKLKTYKINIFINLTN